MKKKKLLVTFIIVILFSFGGCASSKNECAELIKNLETACNDCDITKILDCINPDKTAAFKLLVGAIDGGTEQLVNTVFDYLGISIEIKDDSGDKDSLISMEPTEYDLEKESGTVTCTISLNGDEASLDKSITFQVIKKGDSWYIDGVQ